MSDGFSAVGLINARAVDEVMPYGFIGPFQDGIAAVLALDVPSRFDEEMLALNAKGGLVLQ